GLFALRQAYNAYCFYQAQIKECDIQINNTLARLSKDKHLPQDANTSKRKPIRHNKPEIPDLGKYLLMIFNGKDASQLTGVTDYTWLQLLSETGTDLKKWPTEKHFTSWLGLSPGQRDSGKKKKNARKGRPKAGQIFRTIAQSLLNSKYLAWGSF